MASVRHEEYFEKYWALGPGRSLHKLAEKIVAERGDVTVDGIRVSVERMSAQHHWQERIRQRVVEENQAVRERLQEQNIRVREEFATAFRTDVARYMDLVIRAGPPVGEDGEPLLGKDGKPLGAMPVIITDTSAAIAAVKLLQALAGDPLPERQEVSGPNGTPVGVDFLGQFGEMDPEKLKRVAEALLDGRGDGDNGDDA